MQKERLVKTQANPKNEYKDVVHKDSLQDTLDTLVSNSEIIYGRVQLLVDRLKNQGQVASNSDKSPGYYSLSDKANRVRELQNYTEILLTEVSKELFGE